MLQVNWTNLSIFEHKNSLICNKKWSQTEKFTATSMNVTGFSSLFLHSAKSSTFLRSISPDFAAPVGVAMAVLISKKFRLLLVVQQPLPSFRRSFAFFHNAVYWKSSQGHSLRSSWFCFHIPVFGQPPLSFFLVKVEEYVLIGKIYTVVPFLVN